MKFFPIYLFLIFYFAKLKVIKITTQIHIEIFIYFFKCINFVKEVECISCIYYPYGYNYYLYYDYSAYSYTKYIFQF